MDFRQFLAILSIFKLFLAIFNRIWPKNKVRIQIPCQHCFKTRYWCRENQIYLICSKKSWILQLSKISTRATPSFVFGDKIFFPDYFRFVFSPKHPQMSLVTRILCQYLCVFLRFFIGWVLCHFSDQIDNFEKIWEIFLGKCLVIS